MFLYQLVGYTKPDKIYNNFCPDWLNTFIRIHKNGKFIFSNKDLYIDVLNDYGY